MDALLKTMDSALQELDKVDHEMETYDCLLQVGVSVRAKTSS